LADSSDPLANFYNGLGLQAMTEANPYTPFQGAIPMAGFTGPATDASGNVIPSYAQAQQQNQQQQAAQTPGTTLNSTPGSSQSATPQDYIMNPQTGMMGPNPAAFQGGIDPSTGVTIQQAEQATNRYYNPQQGSIVGGQQQGMYGGGGGGIVGGAMMMPSPASMAAPWANQQAAPAAAPTSTGVDMRQAYLNALANPGKVTTPGAVMQPGAQQTGAPQPSVLQHFLASNAGKTGAGGFTNQPFFNTLASLQSQKGATA
jgi:hypothetical protein